MPQGYLLLVLHAHLPYVRHPEYDRFLEERWLFEAFTETYIPLIKFCDRMRAEKVRFKFTLSISPTLANMMEDPLLQRRYLQHLEMSQRLAEREMERTRNWPEVHALACMYRRLFEEARDVFTRRCEMRLVQAFKEYAADGSVELMTCAATHGFLPALRNDPGAARAQIFAAVHEHQRIFGARPQGMWLPECAYYPGLDALLAEAGVRYFFLDNHGIEFAEPRPLFGAWAPVYCNSGVAAFGRSQLTLRLVWSSKVGYPGDPNYREYHRDIGYELDQHYLEEFQYARGVRTNTGIKYHRVTGPGNDKHLYQPDRARETAERHARDFIVRCRDHAARAAGKMPLPPVIVSPYDAELFGHWWFEGPQWIYFVLREAAAGGALGLITPAEYLSTYPIQQQATPAPSSWGKGGYSEHWVNPKTEWMWGPLQKAGERMRLCATHARQNQRTPLEERVLRQAGRELLLAQVSDWPFIITNGTTEQYARRRFADHLNRTHELLQSFESGQIDEQLVGALEYMDALLPELDYKLFADEKNR